MACHSASQSARTCSCRPRQAAVHLACATRRRTQSHAVRSAVAGRQHRPSSLKGQTVTTPPDAHDDGDRERPTAPAREKQHHKRRALQHARPLAALLLPCLETASAEVRNRARLPRLRRRDRGGTDTANVAARGTTAAAARATPVPPIFASSATQPSVSIVRYASMLAATQTQLEVDDHTLHPPT